MRKLATIRTVDAIDPIPDADFIETATVGGWKIVTGKGNFKVGNQAIYCEIDSWIPNAVAPFLTKEGQEPKEYEGVKGERLRTVKLRKQLSQGLLLPLRVINEYGGHIGVDPQWPDGIDVSHLLDIIKWEAPIPACLGGSMKGGFPGVIPKTDQERVQNLTAQLKEWGDKELTWEVTEKLEGTSMTVYFNDGEFGICGRNIEYFNTEGNSYWKVALRNDLETKLRKLGKNIALQGELIGEGIQGNPYKLKGQGFYLFDVFLIDEGQYATADERYDIGDYLNTEHVPVTNPSFVLLPQCIDSLLEFAEGKSRLADTEREGLVFKCIEDPSISFKAVSNKYLLKERS